MDFDKAMKRQLEREERVKQLKADLRKHKTAETFLCEFALGYNTESMNKDYPSSFCDECGMLLCEGELCNV